MKKILLFKILYDIVDIIFVLFTYITYFILFIETYKYSGFIKKHFIVSSWDILNVCVILGIIVSLRYAKYKEHLWDKYRLLYKFVFRLNMYLLPLVVLLSIYFNQMEKIKSINYVFMKYHIQPDNFFPVIMFGLYIIFIQLLISLYSYPKAKPINIRLSL